MADRDRQTYHHQFWTTDRWQGFDLRQDDILICTAYKAGTTWTQRICSLLVFQSTDLPRPLTTYSPWLELVEQPVEVVHKAYADQTHRRFIKTHTPLDGLPWRDDLTYLFVARDPRDIFMSMLNHIDNSLDEGGSIMTEPSMRARLNGPVPESLYDRLKTWLSVGGMEGEGDGWPFWSVFHHARSFWEARERSNVHLFHYSDMLADLDGEMRKMALALKIPVNEDVWPKLVEAAGFQAMKARADDMAPDVDHGGWKDNARFFNKGGAGNWRSVWGSEEEALYQAFVEKLPKDLAGWLHRTSD